MINGVWQPLEVPYRYVVEMLCDRVAACKVYQKEKYTSSSAINYWNTRNDKVYMHPKTAALLESMLKSIEDRGEEATFQSIKENIRHKKR